MRRWSIIGLIALAVTAPVHAQAKTWRFRWRKGDVLTYRVEHTTKVTETRKGKPATTTTSKLNLVKRWRVLDVDDLGVATVQMSLVSMRNEQTLPNGEVLLFDSTNLDKSTPAMRKSMMQLIGRPVADLRVDGRGQVLSAKPQPLQSYQAEPPFLLVLPAPNGAPSAWHRNYILRLDPPAGTGEKYEATQQFRVKNRNPQFAAIESKTVFKKLPDNLQDRIPLFQRQRDGYIVFDHHYGRIQGAHFHTERDLQNHQGPGSRYHFESTYKEDYVPGR